MKKRITLLFLVNIFYLTAFSQTYITHVAVVDVVNQKIIPEQTVVVTGDIISAIELASKIKIPTHAKIIDGVGKYLIPGLTDAHVHFFQSGGLYTRPEGLDFRKIMPYEKEIDWVHNNMEDFLRRYMQLGITTVVDVGATYNFLQERDSFANKNYAPTIYMTGPLLTSWEPPVYKNLKNDEPFRLFTSIEEAKKMVQEQLPFHPDFIKIWYIINPANVEKSARKYEPIVKAIIEESHKNNLKVAVHATERITAQLAVENGCDYLVHEVEDEVVSNDFIKLLKEKNVILCPTLIVADGYDKTFGQKNDFSLFDLTKSNPTTIGSLYDLKHLPDTSKIGFFKKRYNSPKVINATAHTDSVRMVNLKKMMDAGITIVAGTDAGNVGTQHASSLLSELKAMQVSGLTNWQILQTATINAAKIFNKENSVGSIALGKKADMVLLKGNPVENLENLSKINLVIHKGFVINPDSLIKETAVALVQRQVNGYNARNLAAFLEPYAEDVELYDFPNKLLAKGKAAMSKMYADFLKNTPDLHCEIKERSIQGNIITDKESVSGIGKTNREATAIYHIERNKIKKVYFKQ